MLHNKIYEIGIGGIIVRRHHEFLSELQALLLIHLKWIIGIRYEPHMLQCSRQLPSAIYFES